MAEATTPLRSKTRRGELEMPLRLAVDPRFQDRERQPGLDLLRALAIIVVVIYHAALFGFKLPGRVDRFGWIGVDLFFVLSGYLIGGILLPTFLAWQNPAADFGVSFRAFQSWIYYPTWTRLDPLVFGVALAAIEKFRPQWWQRLMNCAPWLWLPGVALIAFGLYLGEGDYLSVAAAIWQFPLIALGMAVLLICAVSPRLPFRRVAIPGAAFIASIAYSAYLIQKLVIHFVAQFCTTHDIALTSVPALC